MISNNDEIILKHYENRPLIVKNLIKTYVNDDCLYSFDVVLKSVPTIKKSMVLWKNWFKTKEDMMYNIRIKIRDDDEFRILISGFNIAKE